MVRVSNKMDEMMVEALCRVQRKMLNEATPQGTAVVAKEEGGECM